MYGTRTIDLIGNRSVSLEHAGSKERIICPTSYLSIMYDIPLTRKFHLRNCLLDCLT